MHTRQRKCNRKQIQIEWVSLSYSPEYNIKSQNPHSEEVVGRYKLIIYILSSLLISIRGNRNLIKEVVQECKPLILCLKDLGCTNNQ